MTKGAREPDSGLRCVTVGGPFDASEDASLGVCLCCQKAQKGCSFRAEPSSSWAKKHSWVEVEWDAATKKSRVREGGARHRRSPGVEEAEEESGYEFEVEEDDTLYDEDRDPTPGSPAKSLNSWKREVRPGKPAPPTPNKKADKNIRYL